MGIQIKKLSGKAVTPSRANPSDAGYDLFAVDADLILPGQRKLFKTNIAMAIPEGYYGRIADRSGNAYKLGLHVLGGVIDSAYRGDVGVILFNTSGSEVKIEIGQRIAQIIIEKCYYAAWIEVEELEQTKRGDGGFGSTGK